MNKKIALTYDDIQLVPSYSNINSRKDVSLKTPLSTNFNLHIPIVASPMDTVCEYDMAAKLMDLGGVGCVHRFMSIKDQANITQKLYHHLITDISKNSTHDCYTSLSQIPIMAAIGVKPEDKIRASELVKAYTNVLLIDVAHGDHKNVIDMIKWCKDKFEGVDIIAGNIATKEAAERLEEAGADALRVGIGNGSLCTTRIKTGFGIPSITSIKEISEASKLPIMADGGLRSSGDMAKALALGGSTVMLGSLIAGTDETPGKLIDDGHHLYKRYRGSASLETKSAHNKETRNIEGEATDVPYKGSVENIINDLVDGLKSALSYAGVQELTLFFPDYVRVTQSGVTEAKPHLL